MCPMRWSLAVSSLFFSYSPSSVDMQLQFRRIREIVQIRWISLEKRTVHSLSQQHAADPPSDHSPPQVFVSGGGKMHTVLTVCLCFHCSACVLVIVNMRRSSSSMKAAQ